MYIDASLHCKHIAIVCRHLIHFGGPKGLFVQILAFPLHGLTGPSLSHLDTRLSFPLFGVTRARTRVHSLVIPCV